MGQGITHQIGVLNIGRTVKIASESGRMYPAVLTGGDAKRATVKSQGMGEHFVEWASVRDWTSRNTMPLIRASGNGTLAHKLTPAAPAPPPPPTDAFAIYSQLGPKCEKAMREVEAAEELLDQAIEQVQGCKRAHEDAIAILAALRKEAAGALAQIDNLLVGTQESPRIGATK